MPTHPNRSLHAAGSNGMALITVGDGRLRPAPRQPFALYRTQSICRPFDRRARPQPLPRPVVAGFSCRSINNSLRRARGLDTLNQDI
jgi:hypothetical protein